MAEDFLPSLYDLCKLRLASGQTKSGWHNGFCWDGRALTDDDEVIFWKRQEMWERR